MGGSSLSQPRAPTIIKIGGSVLQTERDYAQVAKRLVEEVAKEPTWVVVSAAKGVTDTLEEALRTFQPPSFERLFAQHAQLAGQPCSEELKRELIEGWAEAQKGRAGRLLSWGEQASAFALRSRLDGLGLPGSLVELAPKRPFPALRFAIVPGFYIRDRHGRPRSLSRGGSDISAMILGVRLGSSRVRFWKEGGGVRALSNGHAIEREVDASELLERIGNGIRPLHPAALRIALLRRIELVLEDPTGRFGSTRIPALTPPLGSARSVPLIAT